MVSKKTCSSEFKRSNVVRSKGPTHSIREYLLETQAVQFVGESLYIGDSDINLLTVERALGLRGLDGAARR